MYSERVLAFCSIFGMSVEDLSEDVVEAIDLGEAVSLCDECGNPEITRTLIFEHKKYVCKRCSK